jgi:hypothetical protein
MMKCNILVAVGTAALAVVLFFAANFLRYPLTEYQCRMEAARAPTQLGARIADETCDDRFKTTPP